jgi:hypothetical protein
VVSLPAEGHLGAELGGTGGDVQLGEYVRKMGLDGSPWDKEALANLRIG